MFFKCEIKSIKNKLPINRYWISIIVNQFQTDFTDFNPKRIRNTLIICVQNGEGGRTGFVQDFEDRKQPCSASGVWGMLKLICLCLGSSLCLCLMKSRSRIWSSSQHRNVLVCQRQVDKFEQIHDCLKQTTEIWLQWQLSTDISGNWSFYESGIH